MASKSKNKVKNVPEEGLNQESGRKEDNIDKIENQSMDNQDLLKRMAELEKSQAELKGVPEMLHCILKRLDCQQGGQDGHDYDEFSRDEFEDILDDIDHQNIDGEHGSDSGGHGAEDEEMNEILQILDKKVDEGPEITDNIASGFTSVVSNPMSKESMESLKEKLKIPRNCPLLAVPKVNPEIWSNLSVKARVNDVKSQGLQHSISLGLAALSRIADQLFTAKDIPSETKKNILRTAMDGARALGQGHYDMTMKRRSDLKPDINPEYSEICSARHPVSAFLYGDNLSERLKESKATAEIVKKTTAGFARPKPYARPPFGRRPTSHLNFNRPSASNNRRVGGFVPKNPRYQYQQQAPLQNNFRPRK